MKRLIPLEYEKNLTDDDRGEYYFMILEEMRMAMERMEDLESLMDGSRVVCYQIVKRFNNQNLLIKGQMFYDHAIGNLATEVTELYQLTADEMCEIKNIIT